MATKKLALNMYDNDTLKWEHNEKMYCLHVRQDETPLDPRRDWDNPITVMACWHRRYRLGDDIEDKTPENFWQRLVRENVSEAEIMAAAKAGKLTGIRVAKCRGKDKKGLVNVYETCQWQSPIGDGEPKEYLEYEEVSEDTAVYYLLDDLTVGHCMTLMEPYAEWLPLWLYDHGGITMSCGSRTGQYADRWDSGQVGWIVALKKTIMEEYGTEYVLTDKTWRKRAVEIMEGEVEVYDQYLTGDVYGFTLYSADPADEGEEIDWNEEDSCWGFYGSDVMENGIAGEIGNGFRKAVEAGNIEQGKAIKHTVTCYTF